MPVPRAEESCRMPAPRTPPRVGFQSAQLPEAPELNLEPALNRMRAWALDDGDLGHEYWHHVAKLLKSASALKARVTELESLLASTDQDRPRRARGSLR